MFNSKRSHSPDLPRAGARRITGHLVIAALLVGGTAAATATAATGAPQPPLPAAAVPGGAGTHDRDAVRGASIPDSAFLQPQDLGGATPTPVEDGLWPALRPPRPCGERAYPSAARRRAEGTVSVLLGVNGRPTVIVEHLTTYRSTGAARYLAELRRNLTRRGGCDEPDRRWTLLATGVAGDQSLLIRMRETVEYGGETSTKDTYLAVARVGRAVVVVADVGWEIGNGHRALVRELITPAVRRAGTLR